MTSHKVLWKTGLIVITAGFVVSLCSKLGYWSIRTELTSISTPNWMRIRYIVFYAMPMAFMILHYLTNRNKKIESFYIFSCLLLAGQAGVRALEYFKAGEKLLFTGLEALVLIGFIICLAESQTHSKRRWLPLLIFSDHFEAAPIKWQSVRRSCKSRKKGKVAKKSGKAGTRNETDCL